MKSAPYLWRWLGCSVLAGLLALSPIFAEAQTPLAPNRASTAASEAPYRLDAGDKLRVTVFGEMDLSGEYEVDGSGLIRLPLVGEVQAGGLGLHEFEDRVKSALERGYLKNAKVSAEVINYRPFYIYGQVNKPGQYAFINGMSVLNAVALAGGYTYRANESDVYVRRKGVGKEEAVPADETTKVYPGDVIRVRERFF